MERNVLFQKATNKELPDDRKKRSRLLGQKATIDDLLIRVLDKRMRSNGCNPGGCS
jgi:hypothetical protein